MAIFVAIVFWLGLCAAVGVYASKKGRSGPGFFALAFLLSPIIGGVIALAVKADQAELDRRALREGMRKCPQCAELVRVDARKCRYCGSDLQPQQAPQHTGGAPALTRAQDRAQDIKIWLGIAIAGVVAWLILSLTNRP